MKRELAAKVPSSEPGITLVNKCHFGGKKNPQKLSSMTELKGLLP